MKVFSDYNKINLSTPTGRSQFVGAINYFMRQPLEVQKKLLKAGVAQYTSTSEFSDEVRALIDKYHLGLAEVDLGWQAFFDVRDFTNTNVPGFRVREVSSGLSFEKRPEGGRAKIYSITGSEVYVTFDTYGGGLEFDQAWFQDQEWWLLEDSAAEFRHAWYRDKATTFYTLIGAISSDNNIAYDTTGADTLQKDINTLNTAAADLISKLSTAGYAVTATTKIKVLSPIQLKGRLERALAAVHLVSGISGASTKVEYNIEPVYSSNVLDNGSLTTDKWFMAVPGLKNKVGEKMPLTVFTNFKPESFVTTAVGWGRYGGYLNEAQWRRLATA